MMMSDTLKELAYKGLVDFGGMIDAPERRRLFRISYCLEYHNEIPRDDRAFIAAALMSIAMGDDPQQALGIKRTSVRPKLSGRDVFLRAAPSFAVERYRAQGMTVGNAIARVATEFHKEPTTIDKYRKRDRSIIKEALLLAEMLNVDLDSFVAAFDAEFGRGHK